MELTLWKSVDISSSDHPLQQLTWGA
jgi:hypothetical protein